jgi:sugar phosphate isomerase/epimerase
MNRRLFIQNSILASAALSFNAVDVLARKKKIKEFGCQLYSVRDLMPKDAKGTMTKLSEMGYSLFESYSRDPFWGMKPQECTQFLEKLDVKMISTHAGLGDITEDFLKRAKDAGLEYVICPFIGPQKDQESWKLRAYEFNKKGEMAQKAGLKFGYHNHSYSFAFVGGLKGQKILLEDTKPELVCFELDMCWSEAAGENTIAHLAEYGSRYELCHVKQLQTKDPKPQQTDLADGIIDYQKLLSAAKQNGMKYFLVEQEQYPVDPLTSMKNDAAFISKLKI